MDSVDHTPGRDERATEIRAALDLLYPGPWALPIAPLCSPTRRHRHDGKHCTTRGKAPTRAGYNREALARFERNDPGERERHLDALARHLDAGGNVGLVLPPGLLVIDADTQECTSALASRLPDAPMQATGRGGHFVARLSLPEGVRIARGVKVDLGGGVVVDVKVPGQHVVCAPSVHTSGNPYTWKRSLPSCPAEVPEAPPRLVEALRAAAERRGRGRGRGRGAWDGSSPIPQGSRNATLASVGGALRREGAGEAAIAERLLAIDASWCRPPLGEDEVRGVARSVARYPAGVTEGNGGSDRAPEGGPPTPSNFFEGKDFVPRRMGLRLKAESHLALGADDQLYRYRGGVYVPDGRGHVAERVRDLLGERFRRRHLDESLAWLRAETPSIAAQPPEGLLNVANGLLDWRTGELLPHTPEHRSAIQLPVAWRPDATCPRVDAFLREVLPDEECVALMHEIMGSALWPVVMLAVAVLLLGPGANGKSVLLRVIVALLGKANVASVPLQLFSESRFASAQLFGKLANICGDLDARAIERTDVFKMVTGGDPIYAEHKYAQPFTFESFALPIFSANEAPQTRDQSQAWFRRWVVIPMERVFEESSADPRLADKLTTCAELEGLLVRAVEGLRRLVARGRFELPEAVRAGREQYRERLDSAAAFLAEECVLVDGAWTARPRLFAAYRAWANQSGRMPVSSTAFYDHLRRYGAGVHETTRQGTRGFAGVGLRAREAAA